jgi:hypothetical protein
MGCPSKAFSPSPDPKAKEEEQYAELKMVRFRHSTGFRLRQGHCSGQFISECSSALVFVKTVKRPRYKCFSSSTMSR